MNRNQLVTRPEIREIEEERKKVEDFSPMVIDTEMCENGGLKNSSPVPEILSADSELEWLFLPLCLKGFIFPRAWWFTTNYVRLKIAVINTYKRLRSIWDEMNKFESFRFFQITCEKVRNPVTKMASLHSPNEALKHLMEQIEERKKAVAGVLTILNSSSAKNA